jgi:hypothetical protein
MNIPALILQARQAVAAELGLTPEQIASGATHELSRARRIHAWVVWKLSLCRCREFAEATGLSLSYLTQATGDIEAELTRDPALRARLNRVVDRLRALTGIHNRDTVNAPLNRALASPRRFGFSPVPYRNVNAC